MAGLTQDSVGVQVWPWCVGLELEEHDSSSKLLEATQTWLVTAGLNMNVNLEVGLK